MLRRAAIFAYDLSGSIRRRVRRIMLVPLAARCSVVGTTPTGVADAIGRALAAVEEAHRVPRSMVHCSIAAGISSGNPGSYDIATRTIEVDPTVPDPGMTVLHELAHHLDFTVLSEGPQAGSATARLQGWRDAVDNSLAVATLVRRYWKPMVIRGVAVHADPDRLMYYLEVEELFARSYSQYIAVKSGNEHLLDELEMAPGLAPGVEVLYPEQWDDLDFRAIEWALDDLMEALNWVT